MNELGMSIPLITVNATYIGSDPEYDKSFEFKAQAVPRVGECILPKAGSRVVRVTQVAYRPVKCEPLGAFMLVPTIVLQDVEAAKT